MATIESPQLLTAEQYAQLPDSGRQTELIRGRVVEMNMPFPRHGQVCATASYIVKSFVDKYDFGHVVGNDSGVVTERNPDSVRGADVAFYSYARVSTRAASQSLSRRSTRCGHRSEIPERPLGENGREGG